MVNVERLLRSTAELLDALRQKKEQLFIGQTLQRPDRKIHRDFAPIVASEGDGHTRGLDPAVG
jgi:hypothetical protein